MSKRWPLTFPIFFLFLIPAVSWAQQPTEMIVYNAKIITVDDHTYTSRLGTIAQAMHIKDGKILRVGSNAEIRPMAGPGTKIIDLKGRTIIPGIIETHEHPWDWLPTIPVLLKKVLTDDLIIARVLDGSPDEKLKAFPGALSDAVKTAKPGQWIYILFAAGKSLEWELSGNMGVGRIGLDPLLFNPLDGKRITREQLDKLAPNNPVALRDTFTSIVLNQKAIDETRKVYTQPDVNPPLAALGDTTDPNNAGRATVNAGNPNLFRWFFGDVMMRNYPQALTEIARLGLNWWNGYGLTAFSSNAYTPSNLRIFGELDRKGQMPLRNAWSWNWRQSYFYSDPYFLTSQTLQTDRGTDYLWFGGGRAVTGGDCTTLEFSPTSTLAKNPALQMDVRKQACAYGPGSAGAKLLSEWIKAGGRYIGNHTAGDMDVDNILLTIQKASKEAGMSDAEIRAKRHAIDHMVLWPRPDQVGLIKQMGIVASGNAFEIIESGPAIFNIFGEKGAEQNVPFKRTFQAGINTSFEIDRDIPSTDMTIFSAGISPMITRKGWDGKVYGKNVAVDREAALKIATYNGAYYLNRENVLGSLEAGKWADFVVLDRDYLTIPEDEIKNIRVLMTVVGGRVMHLVPSLARDIGMQPTGAQVTLGGPASSW